MLSPAISASDTVTPLGERFGSSSHRTLRPVRVVVAPIRSTMTRELTSGVARQFWLMNANSRCSIAFHFEGPGGRGWTVMARPLSSASRCNSRFHSRTRTPFEPPPIGRNGQALGSRVTRSPDLLPPAPDGLPRKGCRVMVLAHPDPAGIGGQIINAVRHRPPQLLDEEVVHPHRFGRSPGTPRPPFLKSPSFSYFLASTEITGSPAASAVLTLASMKANCASRSGWLNPSWVLALACRLKPSPCSHSPTSVRLIRWPWA